LPIYEFLCEACGNVTERIQKVQDAPPVECPECGSKRMAKLVSRSAFQLKGGGWYKDLYASSGSSGPSTSSPPKKKGGE